MIEVVDGEEYVERLAQILAQILDEMVSDGRASQLIGNASCG